MTFVSMRAHAQALASCLYKRAQIALRLFQYMRSYDLSFKSLANMKHVREITNVCNGKGANLDQKFAEYHMRC